MSRLQLLTRGPDSAHFGSQAGMPHVLLVLDGFPKALGGGERIVLRLASLLPQCGYRVTILTLSLHPESSFKPAEAPCPVYLLPLTKAYDLAALKGAFAVRKLLQKQEVAVVMTFFESSDIWAGIVTRLFSKARLVWNRRDMGILRSPKHERAYRALRRLPHAVVAVSERVAQHVIYVDQVSADRVHVVYNGLDLSESSQTIQGSNGDPAGDAIEQIATSRFTSPSEPKHSARSAAAITTIGNVRHVKGHDVLVEAAARVLRRFPDATFTVAGAVLEPEYFQALQSQIATLGLGDRFRFLGSVTDLPAHLRTAKVFVLPSRSEGFSNALVEAMAAGLPCVATDVGGNAEAILDGQSGLVVPSNDPEALAGAIERLLADPAFAEQMSVAAQQTVKDKFTTEAMMGKVTLLISSLLRSNS